MGEIPAQELITTAQDVARLDEQVSRRDRYGRMLALAIPAALVASFVGGSSPETQEIATTGFIAFNVGAAWLTVSEDRLKGMRADLGKAREKLAGLLGTTPSSAEREPQANNQ